MENTKQASGLDVALKYAVVLAGCIFLRFLPRPPNVEPVMTGLVPFGRKLGALAGAAFAVLAILVYDAALNQVGPWTLITAVTYGLVGLTGGYWLYGKSKVGRWELAGFAVAGTLFYDAVTALLFGQMLGYPLAVTIAGQVPFTLLHLASNLLGVVFISPLISKYVVENGDISMVGVFSGFSQVFSSFR